MSETMQKRNTERIIFVQPAYAKYRQILFEKLNSCFNVTFCFQQESPVHLRGQHSKLSVHAIQLDATKRISNHFMHTVTNYLDLLVLLIKGKYSVTITTAPLSAPTIMSLLLSGITKSKCILWVEDWYIPTRVTGILSLRFSVVRFLTRFVMKSVDAIIVEGTPQYQYVKNLSISEKKIFLSNHCSLDYSKFPSRDLKKTLKMDKCLIVLYLGRIVEAKGLDTLIRAFSRIEQERSDVYLLVCGSGNFGFSCQKLAEDLKMKHAVFLGDVPEEDVASYYRTADIFVVPSRIRAHEGVLSRVFSVRPWVEGWGLVVNEAMSMGKPIIATDAVGASEDLVRHGINGYVVKNGDIDELYQALRKTLDNDSLREVMGTNSRQIFEDFNDFGKMFLGFRKAIEYVAG